MSFAVRWLAASSATVGALLTWWLAEGFFHETREVSLAIAGLVAPLILAFHQSWATWEKGRRLAADSGNRIPRHRVIIALMTISVIFIMVSVLTLTVRAQPPVNPPAAPAGLPAPPEPTLVRDMVSEIASSETGLCAEVRNSDQADGATIDQGVCRDGSNQKFQAYAGVDPGTFQLRAIHSGKCMTAVNDRRVVQINCTDSRQFWRFRPRDAKRGWQYWEIRNTAYGGGLCLELPDYNRDEGTPLKVSECSYKNNQQWRTRI